MTPELGNLDDLELEVVEEEKPTTDQRVLELIEWADKQPPETFED